jgi:serine/threonine protein phosphatase PrpC
VRELVDPTTMLIGLREGHRAQTNTAAIAEGDTFVLYTDGLTEANHNIIEGIQSLPEAAAMLASEPGRELARAVMHHVIPDGSRDDSAVLVVRTDVREAERFIKRWHFDVLDSSAASAIRGEFSESLEQGGLQATIVPAQSSCSVSLLEM